MSNSAHPALIFLLFHVKRPRQVIAIAFVCTVFYDAGMKLAGHHRSYAAGATVFVRAKVLEEVHNVFSRDTLAKLKIEDYPNAVMVITTFAPMSEIAEADDLDRLLKRPTIDPSRAGPDRLPPR